MNVSLVPGPLTLTGKVKTGQLETQKEESIEVGVVVREAISLFFSRKEIT